MWTEELRFCPWYCECTCSQRRVRVSDTSLDAMSQRFMCLGYYYSSESGPGSFMATRDELRTVSQYAKLKLTLYSPDSKRWVHRKSARKGAGELAQRAPLAP